MILDKRYDKKPEDSKMVDEASLTPKQPQVISQIFTQTLPLIGKIPMSKSFFRSFAYSFLHPAMFGL